MLHRTQTQFSLVSIAEISWDSMRQQGEEEEEV